MSPRGRSGSGGAIWIGSISLISQLDKIPEVPVEPRIRRLHEGLSASQMRVEFGSLHAVVHPVDIREGDLRELLLRDALQAADIDAVHLTAIFGH